MLIMKRILVFCVLAAALAACSKDKFKTQPQVEIKSFGPSEVYKGQIFTLTATVRDKEGDVQDSLLLVRKLFTGTIPLSVDTIPYSLANFGFPNKQQVDVTAEFSYGELRDGYIFVNTQEKDRNLVMGLIIKDKAGHRSEYVESGTIVLKQP
jgi:hypothetical protein